MLPGVHSLFTHVWTQPTCNRPSSERAIVIQRVLESWAVMAFSSSSMDPAQNRESQTETDWDIWKIHSLNYFGSKKYFLILKIGTSQAAQFKYLCAHGFAPLHGCTFSHQYSNLFIKKICSPFFFNFLTRDFTAFSLHFSSCSDLNSPLRHPSSLFTAKDFIKKIFYGHKYSLSINRRLPNTFRTSIDWFYTVLKSKMVVVVFVVVCTIARTLI